MALFNARVPGPQRTQRRLSYATPAICRLTRGLRAAGAAKRLRAGSANAWVSSG
jgi:hypothetical protein